jgi:hypothetical protein
MVHVTVTVVAGMDPSGNWRKLETDVSRGYSTHMKKRSEFVKESKDCEK